MAMATVTQTSEAMGPYTRKADLTVGHTISEGEVPSLLGRLFGVKKCAVKIELKRLVLLIDRLVPSVASRTHTASLQIAARFDRPHAVIVPLVEAAAA